jgi:tRNA 5-methylaminomethyl-2-thiouridine biosynthesis bifunctional protein
MWTSQLFRQLAAHSHQQTTLATFTAASLVRKGLIDAGFAMQKAKGFGRKREMLYGHYAPQAYQLRRRPVKSPLPIFHSQITSADRIAVIGAGIAGAAVAQALVGAGFQVDVYEAGMPAQAASGNLAGNCLPVIARDHGVYAQWYWQAWLQTHRWWLDQEDRQCLGDFNGAFKWQADGKTQQDWQAWVEAMARPDWLSWQALPAPLQQSAMWIERAGFLRPQAVVQRLLSTAGIELYAHTKVERLEQQGEHWLVHSQQGQRSYGALIMAMGAQLGDLLPEWQAYLKLQKGQVSHLPADTWRVAPRVSWSYQGYATPAVDGIHCVGATFEHQQPLGLTEAAHEHNLHLLRQDAVGALHDNAVAVGGHSAYRVMTVDHLPLVGQGLQVSAYLKRMSACALHPDRCPDSIDLLLPNLWFSVGHGSRGLTSSFLAADYLRALIMQESPALLKKLQQAVHPARLPFRQLRQDALR